VQAWLYPDADATVPSYKLLAVTFATNCLAAVGATITFSAKVRLNTYVPFSLRQNVVILSRI